jgi:hypothetical protein
MNMAVIGSTMQNNDMAGADAQSTLRAMTGKSRAGIIAAC